MIQSRTMRVYTINFYHVMHNIKNNQAHCKFRTEKQIQSINIIYIETERTYILRKTSLNGYTSDVPPNLRLYFTFTLYNRSPPS
jgi:hypothetical protein